MHDIRVALRQCRREKAFTFTVLLTLAICIGANAAIFSVVDAVLLRPLPFRDADRLVVVMNSYPGAGAIRGSTGVFDFFTRRGEVQAFEDVAQYQSWGSTIGEAGATERIASMRVTPSFFPTLGVDAAIGRGFRDEEMDPGNGQVVLLSNDFWQDRFRGDPGAIGQDLRIDGSPYRIVGVLPPAFRVPWGTQPRIFVPIIFPMDQRGIDNWHSNNYEMIARLRPGVSVEQARVENDALNARLVSEWPVPNGAQLLKDVGFRVLIEPAQADLVRDVRGTLYMLWAGVAFVLLIGCVNIANLILARSQVQIRETATRLAIGSPRSRLVRELLTHALILAATGGVLGVLVGFGGIRLLTAFGTQSLPRGAEIAMNSTVLAFTIGLAVFAGLVFGAIPAFRLLGADLRAVLNATSRGATGDRRTLWVRASLVTAQIALAFLLLVGAGLMLASFRTAASIEPGFDAAGVISARMSLPAPRYNAEARVRLADAILGQLRSQPAVRSVGITTQVPFTGSSSSSVIMPEGYSPPPGESLLSPFQNWIEGDYFEAMGIPILDGRAFEPADGIEKRRVVVIDEWLAKRYFGSESALGKRMIFGELPETATEEDLYTIVGVVGTIRQNSLTEAPGQHVGAYYFPYSLNPQPYISVIAKSAGSAESLTPILRSEAAKLDGESPLFDVSSMQTRIDRTLTNRRSSMFLFLVFAAVALFLAVIGIYGVLAYAVAQRTREMGIRIALGSSAREVFMIVMRNGAKVTGVGLAVGGVAAVLMSGLVRSLLYGIEPLDPVNFVSVAVGLGLAAMIACAVPAWQASRLNPVRALGNE